MRRLFGAVLASIAGVASCGGSESGVDRPRCDLEGELRARAGSGAMDCGHVGFRESSDAVNACVVRAFESHTPFYARWDVAGTDSFLVYGMAGDSQGTVFSLGWDSDPSGGGGTPPVISGYECTDPSVDASPPPVPTFPSPIRCGGTVSIDPVCG